MGPNLRQRFKSIAAGIAMGFMVVSAAFGQATLLPNAAQRYVDDNGQPVANGKVNYYLPGTTIRKTVWQDAAETTTQSNPVVLDNGGKPQPAGQTYGSGCYQQQVVDQNNLPIWNNVTCSTGSSTSGGGVAFSEGVMVGTILAWANLSLPAKYLYAAGQAINRIAYPQLFTALTYSTTILCQQNISNVTVPTDISDKTPIGAPIESACFAPGTKVLSKASGLLTMSNPATATTSVSIVLFPWGNGDGSTTFNVPDSRGRVLAGRDNMNGSTAGILTSSFYLSTNSQVASATVVAGGTGGATGTAVYSVGGGTGIAATLNVTVSAGAITTINSVASAGVYTTFPTSPATLTFVSGTGSGVTGATTSLVSSFIGVNPDALNAMAGSQSFALATTNLPPYTPSGAIANGAISSNLFGVGVPTIGTAAGSNQVPQSSGAQTITQLGSTFTGTAQGGASTPLPNVQPTITADYIIKALPDDLPSGPGVTSLGGMTGSIACGSGLTCNAQTVSIGTLPIANGGTGANTASGARAAAGLNIDELTSTGDTNYAIQTTDRGVYHTALTAPRTDTLPLANSVNSGQSFLLSDVRSVVTGTNTVTLTRSGSDTINGTTSFTALNATNGMASCVADGVSRWNCQTFAGSANSLLSSNNAWTGDNSFASGRPWCDVRAQGAVGDGVTDDTAAFAACLTQILTTKGYSSGVVYIPPSTNPYCLKTTNGVYGNVAIGINTGNSSTGGIIFQGSGVQGTGVSTCGVNQTVFRVNNQWVSIRDLAVYGYGSRSTDAVFTGTPPTFQTVYCDAQGSQFNMHNVYVTGGATSIYLACSNYNLENVWASFAYGDGSHLFGLVTLASGGGEFHDSHVDMAWPVCQPAHGATIPAWQASHAYSTASCTAVTVTCLGVSFVIELKTSGTSAGSAPTCAPFGTNITDGTAVWQLVNRQTSYCVQIDTGAVEVQIREVDMTCAAGWNLGVTNTFAGTPPSQLTFTDITPGGGFNGIVNLTAGNQITFNGSEFSNCILAGCAAITTTGSFSGNLVTSGNRFFNGLGYCLNHSVGTGVLFSNNWCNGTDTVGINISASIANFVVSGNMIFPSAGNAWTLGNGVAHALVQNNVCNGSAISNGTPGASTSLQSPCL